jgi:hypothetical protein
LPFCYLLISAKFVGSPSLDGGRPGKWMLQPIMANLWMIAPCFGCIPDTVREKCGKGMSQGEAQTVKLGDPLKRRQFPCLSVLQIASRFHTLHLSTSESREIPARF